MTITEIEASAGVTFNHPHVQYANFRPEIRLKATIGAREDAQVAAVELQRRADELCEQQKSAILKRCNDEYEEQRRAGAIEHLKSRIKSKRDELKQDEKNLAEAQAEEPKKEHMIEYHSSEVKRNTEELLQLEAQLAELTRGPELLSV